MISPTLLRLAAELLELASDEFGNHTCNDFKMTGRFDDATRGVLADLLNRQNLGEGYVNKYAPDDDDVETAERIKDYATDFALMDGMAYMLRKMADDADASAVRSAEVTP